MIRALRSPSRFARGLDGRQQEGYQNANNGNHDEQFNERETM